MGIVAIAATLVSPRQIVFLDTATATSITHLIAERDTDPAILAAWRTAGTGVHVI